MTAQIIVFEYEIITRDLRRLLWMCRLMFFEQAREQAEKEFTADNKDALVRRCA